MSRIAAMDFILGAYSQSRAEGPCSLVTTKPRAAPMRLLSNTEGSHLFSDRYEAPVMHCNGLRSLLNYETVQPGDIVEDLETGAREKVSGGYYGFLLGYPAATAKQFPAVNDVLRPC